MLQSLQYTYMDSIHITIAQRRRLGMEPYWREVPLSILLAVSQYSRSRLWLLKGVVSSR